MTAKTKAQLKFLRMGPRKVRLLIDLVRGMKVADAMIQLEFSKKNAAKPLLKLLKSAVANAIHNENMKEDTLVIKEAFADGGPILHRWMPRAMGRATPIRKRTSHITIVLEGEVDEKAKKEIKKTEKKVEKAENKKDDKKTEKSVEKKTDDKKEKAKK